MSEITVASTTDTQESVNQAAGLEQGRHGEPTAHVTTPTREEESQAQYESGVPPVHEEANSGEDSSRTGGTESAARHGEPAAESETTEEGNRSQVTGDRNNNQDQQPKPGKHAAKKRIDALTRRVYEQQEELDALRERVVGRQPAASDERDFANSGAEDGRPQPTSFRSYEQYIEALADWKAGQRFQQQKQAELVQAEQERTREVFDTYNDAAKSARVKYEDFEEVVGRRDLKIPQAAQVAIIEAGELGPDIAYYLGKHPEVCHELAQMSPMRAVTRIGQIESQVTGNRGQGTGMRNAPGGADLGPSSARQDRRKSGAPPQDDNRIATARRLTSSAPAPITPVGGGSSRTTVPLGELPYRDYKRLRDQEERGARGR